MKMIHSLGDIDNITQKVPKNQILKIYSWGKIDYFSGPELLTKESHHLWGVVPAPPTSAAAPDSVTIALEDVDVVGPR